MTTNTQYRIHRSEDYRGRTVWHVLCGQEWVQSFARKWEAVECINTLKGGTK